MNISPDQIISMIGRSRNRSQNARELMRSLGLPAAAQRSLQRSLRELERQGVLRKLRGGRYALPRQADVAEGIVSLGRRGDGRVVRDDAPDVRIPFRHLGGAHDGDRVRYVILRRDRLNRPLGRILSVVERSGKLLVGSYQRGREEDVVLPVDDSFSEPILIGRNRRPGLEPGSWVVIRPKPGREGEVGSRGVLVEVLGDPAEPLVATKASACRHSIPLHFPSNVLEEAAALPDRVGPDDLAGRQDLRDIPFVTIDGATARDYDDAVAVRTEGEGYRLYVAIADVGHYVPFDSNIDAAAQARGTSVYFPGYCIPMLPEQLSNGICSLKPAVDRLAMVAEIEFSASAERIGARFYSAVIRSRERMTYVGVQEILDDVGKTNPEEPHRRQLAPMRDLSERLNRLRERRGSLELDLPETEVVLDEEGHLDTIRTSTRLPAHRLIEEFMLAANEAVAESLADRGLDFPYRIHEPPDPDDFSVLNRYLESHSLPPLVFDHDLHAELQKLVASLANEAVRRVVSRLLLQSMKQARYSVDNKGHYGLAAKKYCHFTSPIRRYPDLLVHRILKQSLAGEKKLPGRKLLDRLCEQSSKRERLAVDAERDVEAMHICRFMEDRIGQTCTGTISSVQSFGFFVKLDDLPAEGLVHVAGIDDDYYRFDADAGELIGERTGRTYSLGMPVRVRVDHVNVSRREIDFSLVVARRTKSPETVGHRWRKRRR